MILNHNIVHKGFQYANFIILFIFTYLANLAVTVKKVANTVHFTRVISFTDVYKSAIVIYFFPVPIHLSHFYHVQPFSVTEKTIELDDTIIIVFFPSSFSKSVFVSALKPNTLSYIENNAGPRGRYFNTILPFAYFADFPVTIVKVANVILSPILISFTNIQ